MALVGEAHAEDGRLNLPQGNNAYGVISGTPAGGGAISIALTMQTDQMDGNGGIIGSWRGDGGAVADWFWLIHWMCGPIGVAVGGDIIWQVSPNEGSLADDQPHRIAVRIVSGLRVTIVIDGQVVLDANSDIPGLDGSDVYVGVTGPLFDGETGSTDEFYYGYLDDLRIWNLALTDEQLVVA
jgi:hypothetical protein